MFWVCGSLKDRPAITKSEHRLTKGNIGEPREVSETEALRMEHNYTDNGLSNRRNREVADSDVLPSRVRLAILAT